MTQLTYTPSSPPQDEEGFRKWVSAELLRVGAAVYNASVVPTYYQEPRPEEGLLAIADGTSWNPGAGAGLYIYLNSAWTFIV